MVLKIHDTTAVKRVWIASMAQSSRYLETRQIYQEVLRSVYENKSKSLYKQRIETVISHKTEKGSHTLRVIRGTFPITAE